MTPSLQQLAALVPLDPTTLVLLTFALLPARWTPTVVTPALRRPWWLRIPMVGLALLSLAMPVLPWPVIALINAYLFIEGFVVATSRAAPWRRWAGLIALAGFWSLQTFRTFWQTFFEPDGRAHFWFVDFFNKLYLAGVDPLLVGAGGPDARHAVLTYLTEPVAFFSNHLLAMHLMASMGGVLLLTHVLVGRLNTVHDSPLEVPPTLTARLPGLWAAVATAFVLVHQLKPDSWTLTVLREVGAAALVWQGLTCSLVLTASSRLGRGALVASLIAVCLHPDLVWLVGGLGAVDSVMGLSRRSLVDVRRADALGRQGAAVARVARRSFGPAILALTAIPLLTFPMVPLSHMVHPDTASAAEPPAKDTLDDRPPMVTVASTRPAPFDIDRYEHPNQVDALPLTGLTPSEADARCRAEGKALCSSVDWYEACSGHGKSFYVFPSYPYQSGVLSRLRRECNLRNADGAGHLVPAGSMSRCRGAYGIGDMPGNAYEWVRLPDLAGFWGLAGSYYRYSDAQTPSCGFRVLVHETQLGVIDLQATGFRCCR